MAAVGADTESFPGWSGHELVPQIRGRGERRRENVAWRHCREDTISSPWGDRSRLSEGMEKNFGLPLETKIAFFYFPSRHRKVAPGRLMGPGT